jgi:NADPH-dependent glutamate synthase beta subunit-like oxidoreductase
MAAVRCGEVNGGIPPKVSILYRRGRDEMPAWDREVREAEDVGVRFRFLVAPVAFSGIRGRLKEVRLCGTVLGPEDATGRRSATVVPGSESSETCDTAILATGTRVDRRPLGKLPLTRLGLIRADRGTRKSVRTFSPGDAVNPDQTIVTAVRDEKSPPARLPGF